jgi:bifunctional non-homologous end joining protein LigD
MPKSEISNPDKVLFPKSKITKKEIVDYYSSVSRLMLPFLKDRPLALVRYPDGIGKEGFYQKNAQDYFPDWIKTWKTKGTNYAICNDKETMLYLANLGCIEIHGWQSKIDRPEYLDKMVIDIDPPDRKKFPEAVQAALALKKIFEHIGLRPFLMSTGSKGLHVTASINRDSDFRQVKEFSSKIATIIEKLNGKKFTTEQRIEKRKGKVFIDVYRNSRAQLSVLPFSLRAKEPGTIAMPLDWKELSSAFKHDKYTLRNFDPKRKNPWRDFFKKTQSIKKSWKKLEDIEERI